MKIKYWRVYPSDSSPGEAYVPPATLMKQSRPLRLGDCVVAASFDAETRMAVVSRLGIIDAQDDAGYIVDWRECHAEIWVDSALGSRFWMQPDGFAFADKKIGDYGLAELFAHIFPDRDFSESMQTATTKITATAKKAKRSSAVSSIASERLNPIEVIGEPVHSPRAGVVYVLKSAYGYKVGRTRNVPARMRAFGVHLPFFYTILLCAWFDDCVVAEGRYHDIFRAQRINGEWFDLTNEDIDLIRSRRFQAPHESSFPDHI